MLTAITSVTLARGRLRVREATPCHATEGIIPRHTAVIEIATGLALLGLPAVVLASLLGIQAAVEETLVVSRIAGAALLAIGVTSALARNDARTPAQRGVLIGILLYDVLVALLLVYSALVVQLVGSALWPAVVLHTLLTI